MRKTIIAGNWKMNHTGEQVKSVLTELVADVALGVKPEVVVAPVFPYLETAGIRNYRSLRTAYIL